MASTRCAVRTQALVAMLLALRPMSQFERKCRSKHNTGTGLVNLDLSFFKNNPIRRISENFNVQFRAEIFNVLNRENFGLPISPTIQIF